MSGHTPSNFADVRAFHNKFGMDEFRPLFPSFPEGDLLDFRTKFIEEELTEFKQACEAGDLAKAFDALIDMQYVILGTADLMGLPWQAGWDLVQAANMAKIRAERPDQSVRGSVKYDIVKPEGWTPPDIEGLLQAATRI